MKKSLKQQYREVCFQYIRAFIKKHKLEVNKYELNNCWIGDEVGGMVYINDMYFNFNDIRYDIDNEISKDKIFNWYWNSVEYEELDLKYITFKQFCKDGPQLYSPEKIEEIKECRKRLDNAYRLFYESLENYKK